MKQENRDINVAERANTPKFTELDEIVAPLRLELLFNDAFVDMTVDNEQLNKTNSRSSLS